MKLATLMLAGLVLAPSAAAEIIHVNADLTTGANTGRSWDDALRGPGGVVAALAQAAVGDEIWVAAGTYTPTSGLDRDLRIVLRSGVALHGGFSGTESSIFERSPRGTAPSILSGDIFANDDGTAVGRAENSWTVVDSGTSDATAVLDRFVITAGNADSSGSTAWGSSGGGITAIGNGESPTIVDCDIVGNRAVGFGGGVYIQGAIPSFSGCRFMDNQAGFSGGAMDMTSGGARIDRCWFEGNLAQEGGALLSLTGINLFISNSVFVRNTATGDLGGGAMFLDTFNGGSIQSCTIAFNTATANRYGGVVCRSQGPSFRNCIAWGNVGLFGQERAPQKRLPQCQLPRPRQGAGSPP